MNGRIDSVILAAVVWMAAGFARLLGLFMLAIWTMWCAISLFLIAVAVASDIVGCPRCTPFAPGLDVLRYTTIGELGVLGVLVSRRLESWSQPPVDGRDETAIRPGR